MTVRLPSLASFLLLTLALPSGAQSFSATPAGSARGPVARVAYTSDERVDNVIELFAVPTDGSAAPLALSGTMVTGGDVSVLKQIQGGRVLYNADALVNNVFELFVVPDDASAPPLRLNGALVAGGGVNEFWCAGDHALYRADALVDQQDELFRVPLDGSAPPVALTPGLDVTRVFAVTADGQRVLFSTFPGAEERLYVVATDGLTPPVSLADSGLPVGFFYSYFYQVELTGDGQRVVFMTAADDDSTLEGELWSVRLDGTDLVQLNPGLTFSPSSFRIAPDGSRVLYRDSSELVSVPTGGGSFRILTAGPALSGGYLISDDSVFCVFASQEGAQWSLRLDRLDGTQPFELLAPMATPITPLELVDGSTSAVLLIGGSLYSLAAPNAPVLIGGDAVTTGQVQGFPSVLLTPDGREVLYRDDTGAGVLELFAGRLDGSAPPRQLSLPLAGERDVQTFRLALDGRVLYHADQLVNEQFGLYGGPLDGSLPALRLNAALGAVQDVFLYGEPRRPARTARGP